VAPPWPGYGSNVSRSNWKYLKSVGFWARMGKQKKPEKNPCARMRTDNKLDPVMMLGRGFKLGPHWCEGNALTTVLLLLP